MLTPDRLCADLPQIGVGAGDRLEVHSSLRAVESVVGGASMAVQALMDVVTPTGTLMMSAYPVSMPVVD